ncbi:hypothetical protein SAMN05421663_104137 [Terribacillus halophilus]|uniref:Uncharacterized protein n=1 Tax=Terribacillus halophilus TaxID=361279 RepID=A0A1G6PHK3_9BACI|nr:hypothetical protein [Terribacillus halophilus]SDC79720.1 hypothetical protein SAMN05421663_104137 [Terribacillus halophilus]
MSWITPVPAYQYMDYQNRIIGVKKNRYTIEKTNPLVLDRKQDTFEQRVQERMDDQASMPDQERKQSGNKAPFDSHTFGLLTGKGRYIDTLC